MILRILLVLALGTALVGGWIGFGVSRAVAQLAGVPEAALVVIGPVGALVGCVGLALPFMLLYQWLEDK